MKTIGNIAAELQGYDPQAMTVDAATAFLSRLVEPVTEYETVTVVQALGRVLAQNIISPINVPPHDNSAMDGYAFDGVQLSEQEPLKLKMRGVLLAGKSWRDLVQPGECVKIMTGAVMPEGLNTVVPQELVTINADSGGQVVHIPAGLLRTGDNRRKMGEDLTCGQLALKKGTLLNAAGLGLVASLGMELVPVWRKLRIAYFSTGDEILNLGESPREGAVFDSNRFTIIGLLLRLGCEVIDMGVVRDEPALLEAAFLRASAKADAVITSGGVSVGEADFTKAMMKNLGDVVFWKIAMRPGRPMAVGRILKDKSSVKDTSILFGLPGNPVAAMVTFLVFVRPALLQMMGSAANPVPLLKAHCLESLKKKPGRTEYQRGIVSTDADGSLSVKTTGSQGSGVLSSMVQANGLVVLHHQQGNVRQGDEVDVLMFDGLV